jgi:hypothetical protein
MRTIAALLMTAGIGLVPAAAKAQDTPQALRQDIDQLRRDFEALKQQYGDRLAALEAKLAAAEAAPAPGTPPAAPATTPGAVPAAPAPPGVQPPTAPVPPGTAQQPAAQVPAGAEGAGGPSGALPVYGGAAALSKIFNPDIAVIGDFLGAVGPNVASPDPVLAMHESEASFQAVVDPYARADFFLSFGEEGVNLEEGFVTFTTLPGGLLTKVGKFRAAFGKVNTLHNHVLPWADRPLVTRNLVGGEDGISDAGISVARLIPNPWLFLEATGQVFHGNSDDVFKSVERSDVSVVGHLRGYRDISDASNIDLGFSVAHGHNGEFRPGDVLNRDFTTAIYGVDATFHWRPLQRSIYHSFVGRSEIIWSRRDGSSGLQAANGYYVSGDYQLARRWFAGARLDRSHRATDAALVDDGGSIMVTYWPSEFSQVRGQYRRTDYADAPTANEFLFQFQFSIGAHGAHPF